MKAVLGMTAGVIGSFVGTPAEVNKYKIEHHYWFVITLQLFPVKVALIRMTSDGRLPVADRRNYKHVGDALLRMGREEGIRTLWRGAIPTMTRAAVGSYLFFNLKWRAYELIL